MPRDPISHLQIEYCRNCGVELKYMGKSKLSLAIPIEDDNRKLSKSTRHLKQVSFLELIGDDGAIGNALKKLKIEYRTYLKWKEDPIFAIKFKEAMEHFKGRLESEMIRRAVDGVDEPVASAGKVVAYKRRYSDSLLQVALKANDKEKYGEEKKNGMEMGVKEDGTKYMKVYSGFDPDEV